MFRICCKRRTIRARAISAKFTRGGGGAGGVWSFSEGLRAEEAFRLVLLSALVDVLSLPPAALGCTCELFCVCPVEGWVRPCVWASACAKSARFSKSNNETATVHGTKKNFVPESEQRELSNTALKMSPLVYKPGLFCHRGKAQGG